MDDREKRDFEAGLSAEVDSFLSGAPTRRTFITRFGQMVGTPLYMSPEQGRGLPVDGRSDLYSAGVILFEMLTGERPFSGENSTQVIFQHLHAEIPLLPKRIRQLQPLVDSLLAKNPDERFADSNALIDALRPHLANLAGNQPANE